VRTSSAPWRWQASMHKPGRSPGQSFNRGLGRGTMGWAHVRVGLPNWAESSSPVTNSHTIAELSFRRSENFPWRDLPASRTSSVPVMQQARQFLPRATHRQRNDRKKCTDPGPIRRESENIFVTNLEAAKAGLVSVLGLSRLGLGGFFRGTL
jgi:hypothetical protein